VGEEKIDFLLLIQYALNESKLPRGVLEIESKVSQPLNILAVVGFFWPNQASSLSQNCFKGSPAPKAIPLARKPPGAAKRC
jgi:hypothetical protein